MKAKLIKNKNDENYTLLVNDIPFATTNNSPYKRLSIKNCQAIELGYDLDELAKNAYPLENEGQDQRRYGFSKGFQKAIEILGDKKFSEEDIKDAMESMIGQELFYCENIDETKAMRFKYIESYLKVIQSLKKNEWDVEIEMEEYLEDISYPKGEIPIFKNRPKLDANNCLILKKIEL